MKRPLILVVVAGLAVWAGWTVLVWGVVGN